MLKRLVLTKLLARRLGPWAWALTAYDLWQRIPPKQRAQIVAQARAHGPRLAAEARSRAARVKAQKRG